MSLVKRYAVVDRHEPRATTSSSPNAATTCTAGVMHVKAERCSSGGGGQLDDNDQFSMAINDVINSKMEVADDRFSPPDEKTDDRFDTEMLPSSFVVDLTASGTTVVGIAQPDGSSSGQKIPLSLADRRQPILPLAKGTGFVVPEPALRSKCVRNAEVIKARYIRSVQQYRKVCSLIELLAAQHAKLQTRRRQLQRTMCSLSNMYRLNKARSLNGQNGSTVAVDVGVSGSRAQFPLSAVDDVSFYRQSPPPSSADYRPGSLTAVSMSDNVVVLSQDEDFGSEATMMTAENIIRGEAVMESDPKCIYMAAASPPPNLHHVPKSSPLMITTTPPLPANIHSANSQMVKAAGSSSMGVRWKTEPGYETKTGPRDYGGFCQQPNSRPGAPLQPNKPYPVATVAAHCKSNSIDIPVPDYERPVAAHTLKADLSCYSYMQLCRH